MAQIFPRSANTVARASIFGVVLAVGLIGAAAFAYIRSPYNTGQHVPREQPIPFSHRHHVTDAGIDCRYCHTSVEVSSFAGIPPTQTCMNCHSQLWVTSPILEPVRESYRTGKPIAWNRVHNLADFVYFNHSVHVNKGVGCSTCHGPVDQMPLTWQENSLLMEWCVECHKAPEQYLRPKDQVFNMAYQPPANQIALGQQLAKQYDVKARIDCSTCHR
jgi:hypothetical protein